MNKRDNGTSQDQSPQTNPQPQQPPMVQPPKRKHTVRNIILVVACAFVVFWVIGRFAGGKEDKDTQGTESGQGTNEGQPSESQKLENVVDWEITYQNYSLKTDAFGEVEMYAIVEVENKGTADLYIDASSFDLEDESGNLIATYSTMISADPDIIAPGEKGYVYCNMASIDGDIDAEADYTFVPKLKIEKAQNDIIRYSISDTSMSDGSEISPVTIIGRVENNTDEDAPLIWVSCVLFRDDDTPIAAFGTNITDVAAGATASFDANAVNLMNLGVKFSDVARYEVYACKTQYQF